jgi:hypothetical protein
MTNFNPGTVWLITPRTAPAWTAALGDRSGVGSHVQEGPR